MILFWFSNSIEIRKMNHSSYPERFYVPSGSDGKEYACNAGDPGAGRSSGEGNGNPLQCSCLGNPTDRGTWQSIVHGIAQSQI